VSQNAEGFSDRFRRHSLFRIATIYVVAGWLSIQAADIVLEAFETREYSSGSSLSPKI
jgi:hypothetical protein